MLANWHAYHIFYHADRHLMLRRLVRPLLAMLASERLIDRFYFVRYDLGGPHLRVRWRVTDEKAAATAETLWSRCATDFFARYPSLKSMRREKILEINRALAGVDPMARPSVRRVYPDNCWKKFPTMFELERYGGAGHFTATLNLFCLSSFLVLETLEEGGESSRAWTCSAMLRLALYLAWGLANDTQEFIKLAQYGAHAWGSRLAPCLREADLAFDRAAPQITRFVLGELEAISAPTGNWNRRILAEAADLLRRQTLALSPHARRRIAFGHIHMTANRLGLLNPEEAYVSRMLWRAFEAINGQSPDIWLKLWGRRSRRGPLLPSLDEILNQLLVERLCVAANASDETAVLPFNPDQEIRHPRSQMQATVKV
jgi:hypothetical protein